MILRIVKRDFYLAQFRMMRDTRYDSYRSWIQSILQSNSLESFKNSPTGDYNSIVEHRDSPWGEQFYDCICREFQLTDEEILAYCTKNDSKGNGQLTAYRFGICSANSIKYVYHANLILKHMQELQESSVRIVEIGGGYGGLAIALLHYAPKYNIQIKEYNLIDLEEAVKLQEFYLKEQLGDISIFQFHDASTFGSNIQGNDLYLIGIYSLGELLYDTQTSYIETLFPKVNHGFLDWNEKERELPKNCIRVPERPLTGTHNHFVYF